MSDLLPLPSAPPPDPPSTAINGSTLPSDPAAAAAAAATAKRHRRPSVRLGDLTSSDIPLFRRLPKLPPLKTNFKPNPNPNPNRSRSKRPRSSAWTSKPTDDVEEDGFRSEFDRQSQSPSPPGDRENGVHEVGVEVEEDDVVVGVRSWLNRLGFGRYAPVFEIHEVDDEVLPLLTLEDLKDMGISAVGSRRKMFSEIQKLGNKNDNNF